MHTDFKAPLLSEQKPATMYVWQHVNLVMAVFFSLAALANTNDGDWFLWVPIYILPAVLSVSLVLKPKLAENSIWNGVSAMYLSFCYTFAVSQIKLMMSDVADIIQNPLRHATGRELVSLHFTIAWLAVSRITRIGRELGGLPIIIAWLVVSIFTRIGRCIKRATVKPALSSKAREALKVVA